MFETGEMDSGLVGRLLLRRKPLRVPLMEILILTLKEGVSLSRGPLRLPPMMRSGVTGERSQRVSGS